MLTAQQPCNCALRALSTSWVTRWEWTLGHVAVSAGLCREVHGLCREVHTAVVTMAGGSLRPHRLPRSRSRGSGDQSSEDWREGRDSDAPTRMTALRCTRLAVSRFEGSETTYHCVIVLVQLRVFCGPMFFNHIRHWCWVFCDRYCGAWVILPVWQWGHSGHVFWRRRHGGP